MCTGSWRSLANVSYFLYLMKMFQVSPLYTTKTKKKERKKQSNKESKKKEERQRKKQILGKKQ